MSKLIHIHISPAAHKDLQREAAKDKRTLGQMARFILEAELEKRVVADRIAVSRQQVPAR